MLNIIVTIILFIVNKIKYYCVLQTHISEENLAKSESSMLPESKMDFDYAIDYRKHGSLSYHWN